MPTGRVARSRAAERSPLRRAQPSRSSTPGDTPTPKKLQRGSTKVAATQIVLLLSSDEETSPPRQLVNPATPETVAEARNPPALEQLSVVTPSPAPPSEQPEVKTSVPSHPPSRAAPSRLPQPAAELAFESLFQYDSPASPPHFSGSSGSSSDSDSDGLLDALTQRAGRKGTTKKFGGLKPRPSTHKKELAPVRMLEKQQSSPETGKRKADVAVDEWLAPPPETDSDRRLCGDDELMIELRQRKARLAELASDGARLAEEMEAAAARAQAERESPSGSEESSDEGDTQNSQDQEEATEATEGALVVLQLLSKSGEKHRFRVRKTDPLAKLFGAYVKKVHGPAASKDDFCYVFDGDPLDPQATPAMHDMEDDDIVEIVQRRQ